MKFPVLLLTPALALLSVNALHAQSTPVSAPVTETAAAPALPGLWSAWGGEVGIRWNRDLAGDIGLNISAPQRAHAQLGERDREQFSLRRSGSLEFKVERGYFRGFLGGSLQADGGYQIGLADGSSIDLSNFRLRPRAGDPLILELVGSDGVAWFYIDRLMYELTNNNRVLDIGAMDMRISDALAQRIGHPEVADWPIADLGMETEVQTTGAGAVPLASNPHWPSTPAPSGGTWEADLFMQNFSMIYSRCQSCTGPAGTGQVVFTPSSTLKNNVNAGSLVATIPGQGALGTSTALWAASIPWNQKFTGNKPPYGNDQHPYLIWNMYRQNADGSIEQIGRSGVKHAWLTTNGGCLDTGDHDGHVLGRGCTDTYGTGNNDTSSDLGPRSEIIPASGLWGRCGSIFDPNCTNNGGSGGNSNFDQRMKVDERNLSATLNPGASYWYESWYIARDDINIYNSMATLKSTQPQWSGSTWTPGSTSGYKLGPAIDRWVDPANPQPGEFSTELANGEGHAKLAVKVVDLGNGTWRYDYALMNLDFARAVTSGGGSNPDMPDTNSLRVLSNRGFNSFGVALPADAVVSSTRFRDGNVGGAPWTVNTSGNAVRWTAPTLAQTLDWGVMYTFSMTVNKPPVSGLGQLGVAEAGTPAAYTLQTLSPTAEALPIPAATITPASLNFSINVNAQSSSPVVLGNNGESGSALAFTVGTAPSSCSAPGAVGWLSVTPATGSVPSGSTTSLAVTVNSTGLEAGGYVAKLCIASNDPAQAMIELPVTLGVNGQQTYSVGGSVSGLAGTGLSLRLNGGTPLAIAANGPFVLPGTLPAGSTYTVSVGNQPVGPAQVCAVSNGTGTIATSNVTNVAITCSTVTTTHTVGGTVSGMLGSGMKLRLNSGSNLIISSNGPFTFSTLLAAGEAYSVAITSQPANPAQVCTISNGSGVMGGANVVNVAVNCPSGPSDVIFAHGFDD